MSTKQTHVLCPPDQGVARLGSAFETVPIRIRTISNPSKLVEGVTTSMSSEFENELKRNKVQFVRIRDKNVNFFLCHFQRFVLFLQSDTEISLHK